MLNSDPAQSSPEIQAPVSQRRAYSRRRAFYGRPARVSLSRDSRAFLLMVAAKLLTGNYLSVFKALIACANNDDGACFPSHQAIADRMARDGFRAVHVRTVIRAIKAAEAAGLVTWDRRLRKVHDRRGRCIRSVRTSNSYRFIRKPTADDYRPVQKAAKSPLKEAGRVVSGLVNGLFNSPCSGAARGVRAAAPIDPGGGFCPDALDRFFKTIGRK